MSSSVYRGSHRPWEWSEGGVVENLRQPLLLQGPRPSPLFLVSLSSSMGSYLEGSCEFILVPSRPQRPEHWNTWLLYA